MPKNIRNLTVCSTLCFKKKLDLHLSTIPDLPNTPSLSNSLDNKYQYQYLIVRQLFNQQYGESGKNL